MTIPAHFRRILAATGAATALALGASAGVAAADQATGTADGVFHYFSAVAGQQVIADPAEGVCMDSPARLWSRPCTTTPTRRRWCSRSRLHRPGVLHRAGGYRLGSVRLRLGGLRADTVSGAR